MEKLMFLVILIILILFIISKDRSIMNCAQRICVYAVWGFSGLQATNVSGKEHRSESSENTAPETPVTKNQFQWNEHSKLSWDDFRGTVKAETDASAAATYCAIGFKTNAAVPGGKPEIVVYNKFYAEKSWVRNDAKIQSVLEHEQGHFDLCEIYTRKLKSRISKFNYNIPNVKEALMKIYSEISNEYEIRQQAYEQETIHGTNMQQQKKWREIISKELI